MDDIREDEHEFDEQDPLAKDLFMGEDDELQEDEETEKDQLDAFGMHLEEEEEEDNF